MSPRIVVVPPSFAEIGEIAREMAPAGFDTAIVSAGEAARAAADAEYVVCYPSLKMPDAFYRAASKLKLVQLLSAGYDDVDLEAARRAKVRSPTTAAPMPSRCPSTP